METNDLFNRIKAKDREAFKQLTEEYGWKVYSRIRETTEDRDQADLIFNKTFSRFYNTIEDFDSNDPIEAMLCVYAAVVADEMEKSAAEGKEVRLEENEIPVTQDLVPDVEALAQGTDSKKKEKKEKKARKHSGFVSFLYVIGILLLIAGIAAAVWVMAGLLMDLNILPDMDWGYSWFNANIADWF